MAHAGRRSKVGQIRDVKGVDPLQANAEGSTAVFDGKNEHSLAAGAHAWKRDMPGRAL